jgi:hypothetical protein
MKQIVEEWKPVEGFPNHEISNMGRCRNVRRNNALLRVMSSCNQKKNTLFVMLLLLLPMLLLLLLPRMPYFLHARRNRKVHKIDRGVNTLIQ